MYRQTLLTIAAVVSLSACSKPEEAAPQGSASASSATASVPTLLSCNGPVTKGATASGILQSFGPQAREETIPGPEGTTQDAVVLYPDDPARKVVITFWDEAKTQLADVRAGRGAVAWGGPGHIRIGSSLKEVETANGKGFDLYGFEWDYGGYAADFKGGTLGALPGGCVLSLRFAPPEGHTATLGNDIVGDRQIASANANMQALQPVLVEMSVGWPSPDASVE